MMHKRPVDPFSCYEGVPLTEEALRLDTSEDVLGPLPVERFRL